jgi:hypothetical protein
VEKKGMGKYTSHEYEWVDDQISSKLRVITKVILANIPYVRSIFLTGGFGKGEGSVKITKSKTIICLRDFDIAVIVDKVPNEKDVRELYEKVYESFNTANPECKLFRFSNFVVDIKFLRKQDLIYPDIWFYDLKSSSKLLYGEDTRILIPGNGKELPLSSGLRVLFEKISGLLGFFPYLDYFNSEKISEEEQQLLIFECYKTFIEMCTALCILAGKYEPKYADRAEKFEKFYNTEYPELAKVLSDLPKRVTEYTNFKLKPDYTEVREDPLELWFLTRDYLEKVLRLYIERYVDMTEFNWKNSPIYFKSIADHYYDSFIKSLIHKKFKFSNRSIVSTASLLYQTLTNMEYSYVVTRNFNKLYLRPLQTFHISPSLKFFSASIMILLSINKDGSVEKNLFKEATKELRKCVPVEIDSSDISGWDALRKNFLRAYRLYRGYHFVK